MITGIILRREPGAEARLRRWIGLSFVAAALVACGGGGGGSTKGKPKAPVSDATYGITAKVVVAGHPDESGPPVPGRGREKLVVDGAEMMTLIGRAVSRAANGAKDVVGRAFTPELHAIPTHIAPRTKLRIAATSSRDASELLGRR